MRKTTTRKAPETEVAGIQIVGYVTNSTYMGLCDIRDARNMTTKDRTSLTRLVAEACDELVKKEKAKK